MAKDNVINLKEDLAKNGDSFDSIRIDRQESSLAEFTKRNVPSEKEVEAFEKIVASSEADSQDAIEGQYTEVSEKEIEDSLNEIYRDDNGVMADVKKFKGVKRHGFIFWFFIFIIFSAAVAAAGYYGYGYVQKKRINETAVDFSIEGKNEIIAGEEFTYTIYYQNKSGVILMKPQVEIQYPENFVFVESVPAVADKNNVWQLGQMTPEESGKIKIKGYFIGLEGSTNVASANIIYMPENFTSDFKKGATVNTRVKSIGMEIDFDYAATALLNNDMEIAVRIRGLDQNHLKNFKIAVEPADNFTFVDKKKYSQEIEDAKISSVLLRPGVWQIDQVAAEDKILPLTLKFTKKIADEQDVKISFEKMADENGKTYQFYEKKIRFNIIKSDLNLMTIINGSKDDKGINFGDVLNYSVSFANKGGSDMNDLVIMAILEGDLFDWSALKMETKGKVVANTITWTKEEAPELAVLAAGKEGAFDFSIPIISPLNIDRESSYYKVKSFAQYSFGDKAAEIGKAGSDNVSNVITNKINSDLKINEQVRYFSEDNIPMGTGPHPPKVGEQTSYKVYWKLTNSLHELRNTAVTVKLPDHVKWGGRETVSAGSIVYDAAKNEIRWDIGRMPITVLEARAEFDISVTPEENDRNKIMVLMPGSVVTAIDDEVNSELQLTTKAKTSKLEDDEIATGGTGMVE